MTGLIIKMITCPLLIYIFDLLSPYVRYDSIYQVILVGLVLAIVGHVTELSFLDRGAFWVNNALDFTITFFIVYFSQYILYNSFVTYSAAMSVALIFSVLEALLHLYLIRSDKTKKGDY